MKKHFRFMFIYIFSAIMLAGCFGDKAQQQNNIAADTTVTKYAIVVDAGITRVNGEVRGDIAGDKQNYTGWITPIPGGVGPLTIACLLERVVFMAKQRKA